MYEEISNSQEPIKRQYGIVRTDKEGNRLDYIKEEVKAPVKTGKNDGPELVLKMALIGSSSVGKTSIVQRIIDNNFSSSN